MTTAATTARSASTPGELDLWGGIGWSAFECPGWGTGVLGAIPAIQGKWTFVAAVYGPSPDNWPRVQLYVDDMIISDTWTAAVPGQGQTQLLIGGNPVWGDYFKGVIDNVFIFGDELTDQQLAYIRSRGAQAFVKPNPGLSLLLPSD